MSMKTAFVYLLTNIKSLCKHNVDNTSRRRLSTFDALPK